MKKYAYLVFVIGLLFASCEKEEIENNDKEEQQLIDKEEVKESSDR